MSFSYDLSTNIGKVRLHIGDKDSSDYVFEDEEIQDVLLAVDNNVFLASADLLRALASSEAKLVKKYKIGTKSIDRSGIVESLLKQAEAFEQRAYRETNMIVDAEVVFQEVEAE